MDEGKAKMATSMPNLATTKMSWPLPELTWLPLGLNLDGSKTRQMRAGQALNNPRLIWLRKNQILDNLRMMFKYEAPKKVPELT